MLRTTLAIGAGKLTASLSTLLQLGAGTSLPGKVARKIDPRLLTTLGQQITGQTIAVTGTNGKTTTSGFLVQLLLEAQKTVAHNQLGANMAPGITAALLRQSSIDGLLNAEYGVIEVDEASLVGVTKELPVHRIIVTNLFRDQLDRYGELDTTADLIQKGIVKSHVNQGGKLYLNADDPLVASMAVEANDAVFYGIDAVEYLHQEKVGSPIGFPLEVTQCPRCGGGLYYKSIIFGHLGHYECLGCCGYDQPIPSVLAKKIVVHPTESLIDLIIKKEELSVTLPLPGVFNVYNFLAAVSVYADLNLPLECIEPALKNFKSTFGRAEKKVIQGKSITVFLIKNPVGASEVLKLVGGDPKGRLLIALNDNYADGRDVSWIWDANFEAIQTNHPIIVSGERANDLAIRLKYAGIHGSQIIVEPNLKNAVQKAIDKTSETDTLYILPTYTALLSLRQIL